MEREMSTRVLIVDDSRIARFMVRRVVEGLIPECEITEAGTGDAAVAAARSDTFDLALVDYNMPGRDGLSAAAELIRMNPDRKSTRLNSSH
jgi:CheY-like chemotaxis protein